MSDLSAMLRDVDCILLIGELKRSVPPWLWRAFVSVPAIVVMLAFPNFAAAVVLWAGQQFIDGVWSTVTSALLSRIPESELPVPASLVRG